MLCFPNLSERKSTCFEDEESELFIEVDCFNVEPVLSPAPEGLSQQQVTNMPFIAICVTLFCVNLLLNKNNAMVWYFLFTAGEKMYTGIYIGE